MGRQISWSIGTVVTAVRWKTNFPNVVIGNRNRLDKPPKKIKSNLPAAGATFPSGVAWKFASPYAASRWEWNFRGFAMRLVNLKSSFPLSAWECSAAALRLWTLSPRYVGILSRFHISPGILPKGRGAAAEHSHAERGNENNTTLLALILLVLLVAPLRAELRFAQPVIDAGQVRGGPILVQRFDFLNDGTQVIEITDTRAGCGCLKPRLPKHRFGPGEEGWIEVEVNTLSQPAGPNQWRVQIFYRNGDRAGEAMLQVNAHLAKEVLVEPAALNIRTEQGIVREITVTDLRAKPLTVTAVHAQRGTTTVPLGTAPPRCRGPAGPDRPPGNWRGLSRGPARRNG